MWTVGVYIKRCLQQACVSVILGYTAVFGGGSLRACCGREGASRHRGPAWWSKGCLLAGACALITGQLRTVNATALRCAVKRDRSYLSLHCIIQGYTSTTDSTKHGKSMPYISFITFYSLLYITLVGVHLRLYSLYYWIYASCHQWWSSDFINYWVVYDRSDSTISMQTSDVMEFCDCQYDVFCLLSIHVRRTRGDIMYAAVRSRLQE